MRFIEYLTEERGGALFHAMSIENASTAIRTNSIRGYTGHRVWADNLRRERGDPNWEKHVWVKGISLTRDRLYAEKWGPIVFVFDYSKLSQRYKIIPLAWSQRNIKREREEFLILAKTDMQGDGPEVVRMLNNPQGTLAPLTEYTVGVYFSPKFSDLFLQPNGSPKKPNDDIERIITSSQYMGTGYENKF